MTLSETPSRKKKNLCYVPGNIVTIMTYVLETHHFVLCFAIRAYLTKVFCRVEKTESLMAHPKRSGLKKMVQRV